MNSKGTGQTARLMTGGTPAQAPARGIMINPHTLAAVARSGGRTSEDLLFEAGREEGLETANTGGLGMDPPFRELRSFMDGMVNLGWGSVELLAWEPSAGRLEVSVHNSPLVREGRDCRRFLAGFFAGMGEVVLGGPAGVEELTCLANDPPYCQFRVQIQIG